MNYNNMNERCCQSGNPGSMIILFVVMSAFCYNTRKGAESAHPSEAGALPYPQVQTNMQNVRIIEFKDIVDSINPSVFGHLTPLECGKDIPFDVKRSYYIYGVPEGIRRGFHSHRKLEQVLVALGGSVKILVKTPFEEKEVLLESPSKGLYIGPMIWREMYDFSEHATLLVYASEHYDEGDYIRNYGDFYSEALKYFSGAEGRQVT